MTLCKYQGDFKTLTVISHAASKHEQSPAVEATDKEFQSKPYNLMYSMQNLCQIELEYCTNRIIQSGKLSVTSYAAQRCDQSSLAKAEGRTDGECKDNKIA